MLEKQIHELTEKQDEITIKGLNHEKEMEEMRNDMNKILALVQENPKLASVKKDVLNALKSKGHGIRRCRPVLNMRI